MNTHTETRDVREITRCPATLKGIKCHMTVGHVGNHAGVTRNQNLVYWPTQKVDNE